MALTKAIGYYSSRYEPGVVFPDVVSIDTKQVLPVQDNLPFALIQEIDSQLTQELKASYTVADDVASFYPQDTIVDYTASLFTSKPVDDQYDHQSIIHPDAIRLLYCPRFESEESLVTYEIQALWSESFVLTGTLISNAANAMYVAEGAVTSNTVSDNPGQFWLFAPTDINDLHLSNDTDTFAHSFVVDALRTEKASTSMDLTNDGDGLSSNIVRVGVRAELSNGQAVNNIVNQSFEETTVVVQLKDGLSVTLPESL